MIPDKSLITITDNQQKIIQFINDMIIQPRQTLKYWAGITKQTPAVKLGYIGQHLASLVTGVRGTSTGARGDDLADKSEVKSCNKVDQVDKCKHCGERVMRIETVCPSCGSDKIERRNDSKWLFSVRDEHELAQYLNMQRVVLLLMDYPDFEEGNFQDIRISVFEIYPKEERMAVFGQLLNNHYYHIFLPKLNANQHTNPMNLHPHSFQFYKCNPVKTFECIIKNIDGDATAQILTYIEPFAARDERITSEPMPSTLLKETEWAALLERADYETEIRLQLNKDMELNVFKRLKAIQKSELLPLLNEQLKDYIPLRDIVSIRQQQHYQR